MDVVIEESRFSFRTTYSVSSPVGNLLAVKKFWSVLPTISVMENSSQAEGGRLLAVIQKTSFWRSRYRFEIAGGPTFLFSRVSMWKSVHTCEGNGQRFDYYEHRGVRSSIFQNDRQIADVTKNRIVIGTGNEFDIRMNSDADLLLVACMVIAVNTTDTAGDKDSQVVNIDFGNMGGQGRAFDETWQPL